MKNAKEKTISLIYPKIKSPFPSKLRRRGEMQRKSKLSGLTANEKILNNTLIKKAKKKEKRVKRNEKKFLKNIKKVMQESLESKKRLEMIRCYISLTKSSKFEQWKALKHQQLERATLKLI